METTDTCIKCTDENRTNHYRLNSLLLPITYETSNIITHLDLPRKYTSTHNDSTFEIYISIGHTYNKFLLSSEEAIKTQSYVIGKWVKNDKNDKYEIHLKVLVSTPENPQSEIRNKIFCNELGVVLEGIAFAETALLKNNPHLASTKIFIHFKSIDPKYRRVEYWHRLGYWAPKDISDKSDKRDKKKSRKNRPRVPCQMCQ